MLRYGPGKSKKYNLTFESIQMSLFSVVMCVSISNRYFLKFFWEVNKGPFKEYVTQFYCHK